MTAPPARRAVHLRPALLGVVVLGGMVGTAAREALSLAIPDVDGLPVAVLLVDLVGAFLLGVLLEALLRTGPDRGGRLLLRLGLGTGFCGGFTTYSALAVGAAELLRSGAGGLGIGSAIGSVLLGAVAAWAGVAAGTAAAGRRA